MFRHRRRSLLSLSVLAALAGGAHAGGSAPDVTVDVLGSFAGNAEGASEIVAYDEGTKRLFVTNGDTSQVDVIDASDPSTLVALPSIDVSADFAQFGGLNSVAVGNGLVAVAAENANGAQSGRVLFYDVDGNFQASYEVGVLPDMVGFSPDGRTVVVANEGEPTDTVDPRGSVSIIDVSGPLGGTPAVTLDFTAFDGQEEALRARGVRIFPGRAASVDFEPEYVAVASDNRTAFATLQENNAFAVIDIVDRAVLDIVPMGLKDHSRGLPALTSYDFPALPVLGTTAGGQEILLGGLSGLWFEGMNGDLMQFVTVPDRGPNGEPTDVDNDGAVERPFALPDYQAQVVRFELDTGTGTITITEQLPLTRADGTTPITGLPNIPGVDEEPVDLNGNLLAYDPFGADLEGVVIDGAGNFWMVDEYRPAIYQFSATGTLLNRFVPEGTAALAGGTAGDFGTETLPAEYSNRRPNRGFEAIALDTDAGILYAFIQTPLSNPDRAAGDASRIIRMLGIDPADGTAVAEYAIVLEKPDFRANTVDKIGDAVYAGNGRFFMIDRDSSVDPTGKKYIYEVDLKGASNLLDAGAPALMPGMTLEQHTPDQLAALGIRVADRRKVTNLPSLGYLAGDKPEGLALLPDGSLAVLNDNDFGLLPEPIPGDGTVALDPDPTQIVLGLISFDNDDNPAGLDPSDRDDAIAIANWPVFGMFLPDAITSFDVDGRTYYATSNEGDDRGDFGDDEGGDAIRIKDLGEMMLGDLELDAPGLDPTVFPNAAELQQDEQIGRLNASVIDGDIDADGDIDRIQVYGTRSFTIWDAFGNLVFDSGDALEQITADFYASQCTAPPTDACPFNASNEANDSFEDRSDNKGPEPEAITSGVLPDGRPIVLVGLERIGGVMIYDVSDPSAPEFLVYFNNRDFTVPFDIESTPVDAAGDAGPEDIKYIPNPEGKPLIAVSNEISGTTTLFGVTVDVIFGGAGGSFETP